MVMDIDYRTIGLTNPRIVDLSTSRHIIKRGPRKCNFTALPDGVRRPAATRGTY